MSPRERTYRTEAIILRRKDIGEADRVLTLLTPELGKVRVVAKGIRKLRSRKAGHLELFLCSKLLLAKGREFDIVTQAETVEAFRPLREELLRGAYAAYTVELVDKFTPENQENAEIYRLLRRALLWLSDTPNLGLTARYYELRLLSLAGYQPQFHRCALCGKDTQPADQFFSLLDGGVVCPECGQPEPGYPLRQGVLPLSLNALKVLRYLQTNPYSKIITLTLNPATQSEVEHLLARYIKVILERQLKSVEFLKLIRREVQQA